MLLECFGAYVVCGLLGVRLWGGCEFWSVGWS